jgi:hypothetical protein
MRTIINPNRHEILLAAYHHLTGYDSQKPKKRLKPVVVSDLIALADVHAMAWRDEWLYNTHIAIATNFAHKQLVTSFARIVERVARVDEYCARTMDDCGDDEETAMCAAYGLAVLHWYRHVERGEADALFGFTDEECLAWLQDRTGPLNDAPAPTRVEQLTLF